MSSVQHLFHRQFVRAGFLVTFQIYRCMNLPVKRQCRIESPRHLTIPIGAKIHRVPQDIRNRDTVCIFPFAFSAHPAHRSVHCIGQTGQPFQVISGELSGNRFHVFSEHLKRAHFTRNRGNPWNIQHPVNEGFFHALIIWKIFAYPIMETGQPFLNTFRELFRILFSFMRMPLSYSLYHIHSGLHFDSILFMNE